VFLPCFLLASSMQLFHFVHPLCEVRDSLGETTVWEVSAKKYLLQPSLANHSLSSFRDLCPISLNSFCLWFLYVLSQLMTSSTVHCICCLHLSLNRILIIYVFLVTTVALRSAEASPRALVKAKSMKSHYW